jgi:hypothetical protein
MLLRKSKEIMPGFQACAGFAIFIYSGIRSRTEAEKILAENVKASIIPVVTVIHPAINKLPVYISVPEVYASAVNSGEVVDADAGCFSGRNTLRQFGAQLKFNRSNLQDLESGSGCRQSHRKTFAGELMHSFI